MSLKDTIRKLNTKIDTIQKSLEEDEFNKKIGLNPEDLKVPEIDTSAIKNKLEEFKGQLRNKRLKRENKDNIFEEVVKIFDKILMSGRKVAESETFIKNQRLRQHVIDSAEVTANSAKQIVLDSSKKVLFAGDGICGGNGKFEIGLHDNISIRPKEIDFLSMLKVDPSSDYGKIMYEGDKKIGNKIKVNKGLYDAFTGSDFEFTTPNESNIFTMSWDTSGQTFNVTGLTQVTGVSLNQFFDDYYSNIEWPDINDVIKKAMLLTVKAANTSADKNGVSAGTSLSGMEDPLSFTPELDNAINSFERLINKLFASCNKQVKSLSGQTTIDLFNEEDDEFYFNFDDVEGIDLEDEDARKRKVLKFKDCDNFEVPYNAIIMEDFVYLEGKLNKHDWIRKTLDKAASDAYEQSDSGIKLSDFKASLNLGFIYNIPKSMVMSNLSPKMFLPVLIVYKMFTPEVQVNTNYDAKNLMSDLKKLFKEIITQIFWKFIREFWKRVKVDLKNFISRIVRKIIKDKLKRYYIVIAALVALLKKIIEEGIDNCGSLFDAINSAIDAAINSTTGLKIPNALLLIADRLPGFSSVKTHMEAVEKMNAIGVPTDGVNGEPNYLMLAFGANTETLANNLAKTPFEFTNKPMLVAGPFPGIIPPMSMRGGALMKTS